MRSSSRVSSSTSLSLRSCSSENASSSAGSRYPRSSARPPSAFAWSESSSSCSWFCVNCPFQLLLCDLRPPSHCRWHSLLFPGGTALWGRSAPATTQCPLLFRCRRLFGLRANGKIELDLVLVVQDEPGTKRFAVP